MGQFLHPYYERGLADGTLSRDAATELVAAFCIKLCEVLPVFSKGATRLHGGLMSGQAVTIGGTDRWGRDATNDLSFVFLDVADRLRMRQPNFHARIHPDTPASFLDRIDATLCDGANIPALYNDVVIVEALRARGYDEADSRDFAVCGCVEPVAPGKTFGSTDAALFNLPIVLELALNEGRRFHDRHRVGTRKPPVSSMRTMRDVERSFERPLQFMVERMVRVLRAVEHATCSTAGGARYHSSGVQCVGPSDTGDSLYAIERAVFVERRFTLAQLVEELKGNLEDPGLAAYLRGPAKFGNDEPDVDRFTAYVVEYFSRELAHHSNTRRGPYVAGIYSMTTHFHFGSVTGALASGRRGGECFASGVAPGNGKDLRGPTALFNSVNRIDCRRISNGANLNVRFDHRTLRG
jgi:pyruvate-formate lyase